MGFAIAERVSEETAEIISLLVLPECRRQGIGTKLLVHLEQELKQQGCQQLSLTYQTTALTGGSFRTNFKKIRLGCASN